MYRVRTCGSKRKRKHYYHHHDHPHSPRRPTGLPYLVERVPGLRWGRLLPLLVLGLLLSLREGRQLSRGLVCFELGTSPVALINDHFISLSHSHIPLCWGVARLELLLAIVSVARYVKKAYGKMTTLGSSLCQLSTAQFEHEYD